MSVDESIPGFGRNNFSEYGQPQPGPAMNKSSVPMHSKSKSPTRSASAPEQSFYNEREKELPTYKVSRVPENLPTPGNDGIPAPHLVKDNEGRSSTTHQPTASIPRRGTKRPVAADFDSEPMLKTYTPPLSRTGSGAGFGNGAAYHPNPHVRRKMNGAATGGFASLNNARRCVIDVSDSEDDTSEDETPSTAIVPRETLSNARDSALALELEIERMRKIIREREEMKLRKQAVGGIGSHCGNAHLQMAMGRWRQAGRRLFLGNRPRCSDLRARRQHRRARRETRFRLTMATPTFCPKMVRSFFSPRESGVSLSGDSRDRRHCLPLQPGAYHVL